ncbi:DUF29 domain-containing protein [Cyanothece sp. BG0011]|uniref:DUF29 domain-containing protein n=1 Tax=Cyanothece sp. BG0011 TaxID=2082950 RepID=UPI000D1EC6AE|nr:DUF29 domain-containing protein [Cyanothece sp. BG0011]
MVSSYHSQLSQLYDQDFVLWVDETVKSLYNKDLEHIDWPHLIEEIEGLGREQRHKVDSYLVQLLIHLLLYRYWQAEKEKCQRGWENEIDNFRLELELLFESKTLYNYYLKRIDELYPKAKKRVIKKTNLPSNLFPETCPFTPEQLLNIDFLP